MAIFQEDRIPVFGPVVSTITTTWVYPRAYGTLMMSEAVWRWHQRLFVGEHLGLGDWEGPHKVSQVGDERQVWLGDCGMDCSRRLFAY